MCALLADQHEAAMTLIVNGARLDLQNSHKMTAINLGREMLAPDYLMQALEGDPDALARLRHMVFVATSNRYLISESC